MIKIFNYTITKKVEILTPFGDDFKDVKKELSQGPGWTKNKSTYPNGFEMEMTQYADRVEIKSNKELVDNGDGTMSVKL